MIDTQNYKNYNLFNIDVPVIEENMTELLLKNKKLINKDLIMGFSYNNEIFDNQISDLITRFKGFYTIKDISTDDKVFLFNLVKDNKNLEFYEMFINNFVILIEHLNNVKNEEKDSNDVNSESIIYDVLKQIDAGVSPDFLDKFKDKNNLTVSKISEIFYYFIKLIFKDIKDEVKKYQEQKETKENLQNNFEEITLKQLDSYFVKEDNAIKKCDLENALRLFITLVLFRENDKENKIKKNRKNLIDYLKSPDLWDEKTYNNKKEEFNQNLNELKICKIQTNQTIWLYNYIIENKEVDEYIEMDNNLKEHAKKDDEPAPAPDPNPLNDNPGEEEESESNESDGSDSESSNGPDR